MGYREASAELDADLVLYNTCTIRDNAEQRFTATWAVGHSADRRTRISPWWWPAVWPRGGRSLLGRCQSWIW